MHWPTIVALALFPLIVFMYVRLARREKAEMLSRFGAAYREYLRRGAMFLPRRNDWSRMLGALVKG